MVLVDGRLSEEKIVNDWHNNQSEYGREKDCPQKDLQVTLAGLFATLAKVHEIYEFLEGRIFRLRIPSLCPAREKEETIDAEKQQSEHAKDDGKQHVTPPKFNLLITLY
jgi:hypothetical protein